MGERTEQVLKKLLSTDEAAAEGGIPAETMRYWRYAEKGPRYVVLGRHVRYRREDLDAWYEQQARGGEALAS